ncbi:hypothetical protein SLS64_011369 [Diaporthe eres]|uniref:DUF895 domain membrane protein n=1 Tax=Diaporthe eres TaxID=83184 RepID=A0ABR1NMA5_DIAER
MSSDVAKQPEEASTEDVQAPKPVSRFTRWFRSPLFNVILVGMISFTQPGIWNALNNTGAGGQQEPYLVNGSNALTFGIMLWYRVVPGIWLGLRELGQLIGSSIQLSLNVKNGQRGKVGYSTYLVLIALQCLGLPLALLVSPPEKVIHRDGRKAYDPTKNKAVLKEFHKWVALLKRKQFYLLIPILVGFNWNSTYQGIYLTKYFSVRARTLGSLTSGIAATAANMFWGWFYDLKCFSRPTLARITWFSFSAIMLGLFAWQTANEKLYEDTKPTLDWASPGFGRGFAVNVLFRFMNESHYMFVYWIMGTFFDDIETLTLGVGLVRSFESIGSCLAFGIGAVKVSPMVNLVVAFVMFVICIPATSFAVFLVPERPVDNRTPDSDNLSIESRKDTDPVVVATAADAVDGHRP